jgi:hypothetical protein
MTPGERAGSAVIHFLSKDIGRAIYLQQVHIAGDRGDCAGCRSQTTWIQHPCILRLLADETIARLIPMQRKATP